jgi:hypothetical protein
MHAFLNLSSRPGNYLANYSGCFQIKIKDKRGIRI